MLTLVFVDTCKLLLLFFEALQAEFWHNVRYTFVAKYTFDMFTETYALQSVNAVSRTLPSLSHPFLWHVNDLCRPGGTKPFSTGNLKTGCMEGALYLHYLSKVEVGPAEIGPCQYQIWEE